MSTRSGSFCYRSIMKKLKRRRAVGLPHSRGHHEIKCLSKRLAIGTRERRKLPPEPLKKSYSKLVHHRSSSSTIAAESPEISPLPNFRMGTN